MPDFHVTPGALTPRLGAADGAVERAGEPARIAADHLVEQLVTREALRVAVARAMTDETSHARGARRGRAGVHPAALDAPSPELVRLLANLRTRVGRYVCERRDTGLPIERVLPEVKALVHEASALEGWFDSADTLMAQVVRWSIEAYYDWPQVVHDGRAD